MPFRKKSKLLDEIAERVGERAGSQQFSSVVVLGTIELLIEKVWALMRIVAFVSLFLFITTAVLIVQVSSRNHDVASLQTSAKDARQSAIEAAQTARDSKAALEAAIAAANNPDTAKATADAVAAIFRIEHFVCGGPCPNK